MTSAMDILTSSTSTQKESNLIPHGHIPLSSIQSKNQKRRIKNFSLSVQKRFSTEMKLLPRLYVQGSNLRFTPNDTFRNSAIYSLTTIISPQSTKSPIPKKKKSTQIPRCPSGVPYQFPKSWFLAAMKKNLQRERERANGSTKKQKKTRELKNFLQIYEQVWRNFCLTRTNVRTWLQLVTWKMELNKPNWGFARKEPLFFFCSCDFFRGAKWERECGSNVIELPISEIHVGLVCEWV